MKKILFLILIAGVLTFTACQRSEAPSPSDLFGPSTTAYVLTLTAHPSVVQALDPLRNPANSQVILKAKLYKYDEGPLANRTVYFYIEGANIPFNAPEEYTCEFMGGYGLLNGDQTKSVRATTDANGIAIATYTPPSARDLRVICDTGATDASGNPIYVIYNLNYIEVRIKATWRGQEWPEDSLSETYGNAIIKVLR